MLPDIVSDFYLKKFCEFSTHKRWTKKFYGLF